MSGIRPTVRRALVVGAFLVLYVVAGYLGRAATPPDGQVALAWPAAGAGVWFLWTVRGRVRMAAAATAIGVLNCAVNVHTGVDPVAGAVFGVLNAVHSVTGALLVRRLVPAGLRHPADVSRLLAASVVAGSLSGTASAVLAATVLDTPFGQGLLLFVVRNAGTTFVVMAAVLALSAPHGLRALVSGWRAAEAAAVSATAVAVSVVVFRVPGSLPILYLVAAVSVWVGTRLGVSRAGIVSLVTCMIAVIATTSGHGVLADVADPQVRGAMLQAFTVVVVLVALSLATLQHANDELTSRLATSLAEVSDTNDRLRHLAHHDTLTGLPNRARLHADLDAMLTELGHAGVAVVFLDLDRFKIVNDTLGHDAGDRVLVEVARALRGTLRAGDLVSRFGGDEFVVACAGVRDDVGVHEVCARLAAAVAPALLVDGRDVGVGVSLGAALAVPGDDATALLQRSDIAMYRMKRARSVPVAVGS
jgi:diguanylate cyclase (GGDEF)-like protein